MSWSSSVLLHLCLTVYLQASICAPKPNDYQ